MHRLLPLLLAGSLASGCHSRFKKAAPAISAVRIEVVNNSGPSVILPNIGLGIVGDIMQSVRSGNIAGHIAQKVDPQGVNQAFADSWVNEMGAGPPFGFDPEAPDLLEYQLVDWGMAMGSFMSPGVYYYRLEVRGYHPNGRKFYKSGVQCSTDAGMSGWAEMSPFVSDGSPAKIKNIPAEDIQAIFDATAAACAWEATRLLRKHSSRN